LVRHLHTRVAGTTRDLRVLRTLADAELLSLEGEGHFKPIDPRAASWPPVEWAIAAMLGLEAGTLP
jgi:hypothetical protein